MTEPKPDYDISTLSDLERTFLGNWTMMGNGEMPIHDRRFHPDRKWRWDFQWPAPIKVAVECEGGIWVGGRHIRGKGYEADIEKYNSGVALGWLIFRCTAGMLEKDPYSFVTLVKVAIERRSK